MKTDIHGGDVLTASEIRTRFLNYFEKQGHRIVPSSPLVPRGDPSLMFVNAGMVQFKKTFLGQEKRDYTRATTSQKCLRVSGKHNDLENVGRTARHHTFFEMLGNFSFGDYFKRDAIRFAWEFLTEEIALPKDRLYITIYKDDDEAGEIWREVAGVPPERIFKLGEKDNFWSMGDTGPCGPCSEIHIDQGEHMECSPECGIGRCECDRYLEIWNLVFMQYDQVTPDKRVDLPKPSIDTGMGLERIAAVCQGVYSNYDSDLFQAIIGYTADKVGVKYKEQDEETDTALRVIADHSRSAAFLITDGILPSNEGRGYVLRRLIRRALRFGKLIGFDKPFLFDVCSKVVEVMGDAYPEIVESRDFIMRAVKEEEKQFSKTLDKGLEILAEELAELKAKGEATIPGEVAFKLYDTYGFPIDIVNDLAEKQGIGVDEAGYKQAMAEQRERAKKAWKGSGEADQSIFNPLLEADLTSAFVGYETLTVETEVAALLDTEGNEAPSLVAIEEDGAEGWAVFKDTPFYGESGGQSGDYGSLSGTGVEAEVSDTQKAAPNLTIHKVRITQGELRVGQTVTLAVDSEQRHAAERNHTCTHLLHAALREVLGDHVRQSGSLVTPERLRFDFTHIAAMTPEEIRRVEHLVNRAILADEPVKRAYMTYEEAVDHGAMALFGEKYADEVCVVEVPNVSIELCGGTHMESTGQAGCFVVLSETGVAAGTRRIEAATGMNTLHRVQAMRDALAESQAMVKAGDPEELPDRVKALQEESKAKTKEIEKLQAKLLSGEGRSLMDQVEDVGGVKLLAAKVDVPNMKVLREQMDDIRSKLPSGVACLVSAAEDKVSLILYVSKDLHDRFTAPALIKEIAGLVGGSGGGRPDLAQAGGTKPEGMDAALTKLRELVGG